MPSFLSCRPAVGRLGALPVIAQSVSVTEPDSLNHLVIANQRAVGLFTGVLAKAITRVHSKLDQPPVNVLAIFAQIGWFRIALPFNLRAVGIEQRSLEPVPDNFLVVFRKRSAKSRIDILREDADGKKANQEEGRLHHLRKRQMPGVVDEKVALWPRVLQTLQPKLIAPDS
jgi:hypothetical protein